MAAKENQSESYVRNCLETLEFSVTRIPESEQQDEHRADFIATRDGIAHVIEVKEKGGDAGLRAGRDPEVRPLARTNTLSSVVCDANEQLRQSTTAPDQVRVAWIDCVGDAADVLLEQMPLTLYGIATLTLYGPRWEPIDQKPCLYFDHADLFRCRDTDAVVVSGAGKWAMFLNEFSPRFGLVAASPIRGAFGDAFDPRDLATQGRFLVCDGADVDRSVESQAQRYVAQRYGYAGVGRLAEIDCRMRLPL